MLLELIARNFDNSKNMFLNKLQSFSYPGNLSIYKRTKYKITYDLRSKSIKVILILNWSYSLGIACDEYSRQSPFSVIQYEIIILRTIYNR